MTPIEKKMTEKLIKVIWIHTAKVTRKIDCMIFSPMKNCKGRPRTLKEIVKRNFIVNIILEYLVFT